MAYAFSTVACASTAGLFAAQWIISTSDANTYTRITGIADATRFTVKNNVLEVATLTVHNQIYPTAQTGAWIGLVSCWIWHVRQRMDDCI